VPEPTVAQRIVRAKRTLSEARVPFEVPRGAGTAARLPSVLEVIYLIFNEGYSATAGDDWMRPVLCEEALRLGRILAELAPREPEVHGLVALMEIQASRLRARVDASGEPDPAARPGSRPLGPAPDRVAAWRHWNAPRRLAACWARTPAGRHRRLPRTGAHRRGDGLGPDRGALRRPRQLTPSPVVELNRAVAVAMAFGPAPQGWNWSTPLVEEPILQRYHLLPSVRGELLRRLGRLDEAREEFERAAELTHNARNAQAVAAARRGLAPVATGPESRSRHGPAPWCSRFPFRLPRGRRPELRCGSSRGCITVRAQCGTGHGHAPHVHLFGDKIHECAHPG
jgi:RNA polymerase sigma-70 factor, ECF subfamily